MKLLTAHVENFCSYKSLDFDFRNLGLALVHGATGSGKSTLQDIPAWILFGVTAKDGNVDEVRSWQTPNEPTIGTIEVETPTGIIKVTRIRGKPTQNDLYWTDDTSEYEIRGKDLADTQKRLCLRLGVDSASYLISAYFHEFSSTGRFFTAKSKDQRALFEQLANLDLPGRLMDRASIERKTTKTELADIENRFQKQSGILEQSAATLIDAKAEAEIWEENTRVKINTFAEEQDRRCAALANDIEDLEPQIRNPMIFKDQVDEIQKKLDKVNSSARCATCGAPKQVEQQLILKDQLAEAHRKWKDNQSLLREQASMLAELKREHDRVNPYAEQLRSGNPFKAQITKLTAQIEEAKTKTKELEAETASLDMKLNALNQLYDLSFELRGTLLRHTVSAIESETNHYLEKYFDAELRVSFTLDGDDLNVGITKNGYECVFTQLSKGQRQLLKLTFALTVLEAAPNQSGVHFDTIMLDEALDGLDENLKVKAFSLFEELSTRHSSILVIDHASSLQSLFTRRFHVTLDGDHSQVMDES